MKLHPREQLRISEQAALRLIRSSESDSPEARADFWEWSRLSAHHIHEAMFVQAVSKELEGIDPRRAIDVNALPTLPELADTAADRWIADNGASATGSRTVAHRWRWGIGIAAACAFLALAWVLTGPTASATRYATSFGEQRSIKLEDGSVVVLNTDSHIKVEFSKTARQIHLLEGEALFTVQHDASRSFRVSTDSGTVLALGTQFNVYRQGGRMRVSVIEGLVQVSAANADPRTQARLAAGDEAILTPGHVTRTAKPDIRRATAWRTRQLIFRDSPLESVAEEFNRYNKAQIRIESEALRARSVSGVFDADDPKPLIDFLGSDPRLRVLREATEIRITPR